MNPSGPIFEARIAALGKLRLYAYLHAEGWSAAIYDTESKTYLDCTQPLPPGPDKHEQEEEAAKREACVLAASYLRTDPEEIEVKWANSGPPPGV